jgi:hypothetical protein
MSNIDYDLTPEEIRNSEDCGIKMDPRPVIKPAPGRWPCDCGAAHQNRRPHDPHCIRYIQ